MAVISASLNLSMDAINFNRVITGLLQSQFYNDVFLTVKGIVYQDILEIRYDYLNYSRDIYFAGSGVVFDAAGNVSGGTATGIFELLWTGSNWTAWWSLQNISYSALDLYNSFQTTDTTDDYNIIQQLLSGVDDISGSEAVDVLLAYGGSDVVQGGGGNDVIDGGSGIDTARFSSSLSQYRIGYSGTTWIVSRPDGMDTLSNFENIQFGASSPSSIDTLIAQGMADELISVNRNGKNTYDIPDIYSGAVSYLKYQMLGSVSADVAVGTSKNDFFNLLVDRI